MGQTKANGDGGVLRRIVAHLHDDRGAAAVPFLLCLPIFLTVVAVLVQFALLVNAKMVVDHAAHMAGRSAMTSLPDAQPDNVQRAAQLVLATLSPQATNEDSEADAMRDALVGTGVTVPQSFAKRYTYAMAATTVDYTGVNGSSSDPASYPTSSTREVKVGVGYQFFLTVPVASAVLKMFPQSRVVGGVSMNDTQTTQSPTQIGGVTGSFYYIHSTCTVQTSSARASQTSGSGWPG